MRLKTLWHQKHHFYYWPFFTVPNIPITNRESGIMTRALPTPTEKGVFFFHQSETYELICNYASCWWITHPHQRTVARNNWPVAMYISDAFTDNICKECGNNTYINLISCFGILCRQIFMDSCLWSLTENQKITHHLDCLKWHMKKNPILFFLICLEFFTEIK